MPPRIKNRIVFGSFFGLVLALSAAWPRPVRAADTLTNAFEVLALSAQDAASGIPVAVKGVVTAAEPDWGGRFFIQDASGGVFVENISSQQPLPGDWVEVTGSSHPGGYAPIITKPQWKKVGTAPLPKARPVTIERLMSGTEDGQRIEISGVVRTAKFSGTQVQLELASGGYRLRAYTPQASNTVPESLVGAKVLLRGTAGTAYNAPLRHFVNVDLYVPEAGDVMLEEAPINPFDEPLTSLDAIAQYRQNRFPANQVHVKGVVTYQRKGEEVFLRDASGGLRAKTQQVLPVVPGEVVEAVGFPSVENFVPVLEDAVFRKTGEPRVPPEPQPVSVAELQEGRHHADYVVLQGRLIDRLVKGIGQMEATPVFRTTLVLQSTNFLFVAERDTTDRNQMLASIPIGSLVEVKGVCLLESTPDGKINSVRVLLPTSYDVRILQRPSWLTPQHLLISLVVMLAILLGAIRWTMLVSKKNSILKSLVSEKEAAQRELQQAHDQLEERVRERTAQLKVEMTVRKESELQFRAVLTERTRLAQDLHDTLEQTMTGIGLQLDLVGSQIPKAPTDALHHLKLARKLMKQGQLDVRQSVWGLRSRAMEEFSLMSALTMHGRQVAGGAGIQIQVESSGEPVALSEIVEESLLRIGQEAITNAVKHSGARSIKMDLQFSPKAVVLQIRDDGRGFAPEACDGPKDGHFGLLGIRERAERLAGQVSITSAPGAGAVVRVEIPINDSNTASGPIHS
jgi:signal transduction histidine kinase